jgi:CBS domain-containing protein
LKPILTAAAKQSKDHAHPTNYKLGGFTLSARIHSLLSTPLAETPLIQPVTVDLDASYGEVRRLFRDTGARVVVALDRKGRLAGVIYRSSVLRVTSRKTMARARDLAVEPPVVLSPSETLLNAVNIMLKLDEWYLPVTGGEEVLGLVGLETAISLILDNGLMPDVPVENYMTRNPVTVRPEDPLSRVWEIMVERRYAGVPVVNSSNRLAGIVTQYDLIKRGYTRIELEASGGPAVRVKVSDAMNVSVTYIYPWTSLKEAAEIIVRRGYGRLPVVDSKDKRILVGILDREDIIRAALKAGR